MSQITTTFGLSLANGNVVDDMTAITATIAQTSARSYSNTQTIGTSEETLAVGADVGDPGWFYARNVGSNDIKIGPATGSYIFLLKGGEQCMGRLEAGVTIYAIAITGNSDLRYKIYDT